MHSRSSLARAGQVLGVLGLCVALVLGCQSAPKNTAEPAKSPDTAQKSTADTAKGNGATADKPAEPPAEEKVAKKEKAGQDEEAAKRDEARVAADREATRKAIAERIRARAQAAAEDRMAGKQGQMPVRQAKVRRINEADVTGARPAPSRGPIEGDAIAKRQAVEARPTTPAGVAPSDAASVASPAIAKVPAKPGERKAAKPGARKSAGCGAKPKGKLTMYPEDGPQPKYVVKQQKVELNDVWMGQKAKFVFEVANEGDAPLEIQLKGG